MDVGSPLERLEAPGDGGSEGLGGRCIGRSELRRFETSTERVLGARRGRTHDRDEAAGAVVLTACQRDRSLLRPALHFLANEAAPLFVDVREGGCPDQGSPEYAAWLRESLVRDRTLVLVATHEGLASPWAPWHLGLAEGVLGPGHVAVLAVEEYGHVRGSPLLELYPVIRRCEGTWTLVGPRGEPGPRLEDWLTS